MRTRFPDIVVAVDTREQKPYRFQRSEVKTLQSGDYSIVGLEDRIAIERKTKTDAYAPLGQGRARAAEVRHQREALGCERQELLRRVALEVETAHRDLVSALAAVDATEASVRAASAREEAVQERYDAGLAPISDVLDAQADLADAERAAIVARAAAWMSDAALMRAVGRHAG